MVCTIRVNLPDSVLADDTLTRCGGCVILHSRFVVRESALTNFSEVPEGPGTATDVQTYIRNYLFPTPHPKQPPSIYQRVDLMTFCCTSDQHPDKLTVSWVPEVITELRGFPNARFFFSPLLKSYFRLL